MLFTSKIAQDLLFLATNNKLLDGDNICYNFLRVNYRNNLVTTVTLILLL